MDLGLVGKRALVLGSTRGLGRAIAAQLAEEGTSVAVCGRDPEAAAQAAEAIAAATGSMVRGYGVDLFDVASVDALCSRVQADFGGIDVLFNNSGGPPPGSTFEPDDETWATQFQAMFLSLSRITKAFLPGMRERGWGRILVTSSSGAIQPIPNLIVSNTIRGGLRSWVKALSSEVAADGVTVNTIVPGRIQTERVDELDRDGARRSGRPVEDIVAGSVAAIPAGRYGEPAEYAAVATFLLSDRASYLTGSVIRVDGGMIKGV